jgi:hypothetical protein
MLTDLDLIAVIMAITGLILVNFLFYKQIVAKEKEITRLQVALRDERRKR